MKISAKAPVKKAPQTGPQAKYRIYRRSQRITAKQLMEDAGHAPSQEVLSTAALRRWVHESVQTTLIERPEIIRSVVEDIWEDSPEAQAQFARSIREGLKTPDVSREEVFQFLEGKK
jgi:hypothetical protein